jgi:hypothetical protein
MRLGPGTPLTKNIQFVYEDGTRLHRNCFVAIERAQWMPSIVQAERLARALGTTLSEMLAEVEREEGRPAP